jgi:hypothetical protein
MFSARTNPQAVSSVAIAAPISKVFGKTKLFPLARP